MPLALVEAMMCGRPGIVTTVGGNAELVEDRVTGFLAAPVEDSLDAALEDAWERRHDLHEMGRLAAFKVRELIPPDPAGEFAHLLLNIADELADAKASRTPISVSDPESLKR
jgi:glycosyltransferase involved in cell wall biosynthesis